MRLDKEPIDSFFRRAVMHLVDKRLGSAIRVARERRHLTQAELASRCGISRRHLAGIEGGANFTVAVLAAIARELRGLRPVLAAVLAGEEERSRSRSSREP